LPFGSACQKPRDFDAVSFEFPRIALHTKWTRRS